MRFLKRLLIVLALILPLNLASLAAAQQQSQEDLFATADGRLRGYEGSGIMMEESNVALTYMALLALTVIALGVLFKSSRRSHLD